MVKNIAYRKEDTEIEELVKNVLGTCYDRDLIPIKIGKNPFVAYLSLDDYDSSSIEKLARKGKHQLSIEPATIEDTDITLDVLAIISKK